jgi:AcrR family transcriptional regulator
MSTDARVIDTRRFTMSELVERTGVAPATVRFYLTEDLLPPPVKVAANRFLYDERHVEIIRLIRVLRDRRGLSLEAIGQLLPELLPDLLGKPGGVFHPDMWGQALSHHAQTTSAAATGDRLAKAGLAGFSARGYADVTIDDVCRDAGIAKGSFYRYFASKEELFFAACHLAMTRITVAMIDKPLGTFDETRAREHVAQALAPYLVLVLDLSLFAVRHKALYAETWRALVGQLRDALGKSLDRAISPDDVLSRALVAAIEARST